MTGTSFWICNEKSRPREVIVCHCHCWLSPLITLVGGPGILQLGPFVIFREDESKSTIGPHAYFVVPLVSPQWGVHVADMQVKDNLGSLAQRFHWTTKSHQLFRMQ